MPTKILDKHELYRLARVGAGARLQELEAETAAIRKAFPDLKRARAVAPTPAVNFLSRRQGSARRCPSRPEMPSATG